MNDLAEIKKNEKSKEQRFYKEQFITSKNYRGRRDLLNAILEDERVHHGRSRNDDRRVYERKGEINGIRWRKLYVTG